MKILSANNILFDNGFNNKISTNVKTSTIKTTQHCDSYEKTKKYLITDSGIYSKDTMRKINNENNLPVYLFCEFGLDKVIVKELIDKFRLIFCNYYNKNADSNDIKESFINIFEDIKDYNVNLGRTTGVCKEDNIKMLLDTYNIFKQYGVVQEAVNASNRKAIDISKNYGGTNFTESGSIVDNNWIYFDADIYYMSESARTAMKTAVSELAIKYSLGDINTVNQDYSKNNFFDSYISRFTFEANQLDICTMINENMLPPKGFTFFYQHPRYSNEDLKNGTNYMIEASDGFNTYVKPITVPKGYHLIKNDTLDNTLLYYLTHNQHYTKDEDSFTINIESLLEDQYPYLSYSDRFDKFCEDNLFNSQSGVLLIGVDDWQQEIDVPYNQYSFSNCIDHFNASDLVNLSDYNADNKEELLNYIKNFNIYTHTYG